MDSSTHRGTIRQSFGGVGRNIADGLSHLSIRPLFISTMGNDSYADDLIAHNPLMETRGLLRLAGASTATYAAILDKNGDYRFGVGDLEIHDQLSVEWVKKHEEDIARCRLVIMDGNVPLPTMDYILAACDNAHVPVWYEPTDVNKASKPISLRHWSSVAYASPNWAELLKMVQFANPKMEVGRHIQDIKEIREHAAELCRPLLQTMDCVLITLGEHGFMVVRRGDSGSKFPLAPRNHHSVNSEITSVSYYPAPKVDKVVSVSGAGDCLAAGFITGILKGWSQDECASFGLKAAECSLQYSPAVPSALSRLVH